MDKVIGKLSPNDLTKLFHALELEDDEIDQAKGDDQRADVEAKAVSVLTYWRKTYYEKATLRAILDALKEAGNIDHMQKLEQIWRGLGKLILMRVSSSLVLFFLLKPYLIFKCYWKSKIISIEEYMPPYIF